MTQAGSDVAQRTPQEIFQHHAESLGAEDLEATVDDYAETSRLITSSGVIQGKAAIGNYFAELFRTVPKARWGVKTTFVDNILFLEWTADSDQASISDGVDTFIFQDGLIQTQTVHCTAVPK